MKKKFAYKNLLVILQKKHFRKMDLELNKIITYLKSERKRLGFSQKECAEALGLTQQSYYLREIGQQPIYLDEFNKLANLFGTTGITFLLKAHQFQDGQDEQQKIKLERENAINNFNQAVKKELDTLVVTLKTTK